MCIDRLHPILSLSLRASLSHSPFLSLSPSDGQAEDCMNESQFSTPQLNGRRFPVHPIPVPIPTTPGYRGSNQRDTSLGSPLGMRPPISYAYQHSYRQRYFSDGGMTDMTYTTDDDDTVATTSVAPSSPGSLSTSHRRIPSHITEDSAQSENTVHQDIDSDSAHQPQGHSCHHREGAAGEMPENPYVSMHRRSPIYVRVKQGTPTSPRSSGKVSSM